MKASGRCRSWVVAAGLLTAAAVALGAAGTSSSAPAGTTKAAAPQELLNHVQDQLRTVASVEADFVQEKTLAMFEHSVTISGHFAMQKPDRLMWVVKKPVRYAIRIEGAEVRQWDQDTNKVSVIQLGGDPVFKAVADQIQAWFMGDYKVLLQTFNVQLQSRTPLVLGLVPKADSVPAKMFKQIDMAFGKDEKYIDTITLVESGGDVTKLKFLEPKLNEKIKPETWEIPPRE
jgi:outer membrane lipoprotein carrier protein